MYFLRLDDKHLIQQSMHFNDRMWTEDVGV